MGAKQLNFNAPLLSVRRFSSKFDKSDGDGRRSISKSPTRKQHSLPLYKSDQELGNETNPAAVPFIWEQIPGKVKGDELPHQPSKELSSMPRLSARTVSDSRRQVSFERSNEQSVIRALVDSQSSHLSDHAALLCMLNEELNERRDSDAGSDNDVYSDALDTLSQTESFSLKCSLGGVSANGGQDVTLQGSLDSDRQGRDFMMSRFLPAAKAMTLDAPQSVSKKKPLAIRPPLQAKEKSPVSRERKPHAESARHEPKLLSQYPDYVDNVESKPHAQRARQEPKLLSLYHHYADNVESDDEEEIHDIRNKFTKICGFFPRFGVKSSLGLLNPVPRLKLRAQTPVSPASQVIKRPKKVSFSGPLLSHTEVGATKKKFHSGVLSRELFEREHRRKAEQYKPEVPSFRRSFRSGGLSPYRNQPTQSPFQRGARTVGASNRVDRVGANKFGSFKEGFALSGLPRISSQQVYKPSPGTVSPAVEKTLYIDPASKVKRSTFNNFSASNCVASEESKVALVQDKANSDFNDGDEIKGRELVPVCSEGSKVKLERIKTHEETEKDDKEVSSFGTIQSPLTPPLPKSPTESWLWRTLPSIPLRYPFSHQQNRSPFPSKQEENQKDKWELVVRTTNTPLDHV